MPALSQAEVDEMQRQKAAYLRWELSIRNGVALHVPSPVSHLGRSTRERHSDERLERCTLLALSARRQP
jgi:hypothetical protein